MTKPDAVDDIREQKRTELMEQTGEGESEGDDAATTPDAPVHVESQEHFAEITGDGVVPADCYADWCGPVSS